MASIIGLFVITAIPTVTGVAQAISGQKNQEQRQKDERRMAKTHLDVRVPDISDATKEIDKGRIVLKLDRLWIGPPEVTEKGDHGYVAEAFYIEYPDKERVPAPMGLVSQVQDDPPLLNWIYIDKDTMEVKYGNRSASIAHHIGPWDWSEDEEQVVFDDMEVAYMNAFYAVQRKPGLWQLFFDFKGNGLAGYLPKGWRKVQVQLHRNLIADAESVAPK